MAKKELLPIGGQAVVEGVMVMAKDRYAVSVRKPNKTIKTKVTKIKPVPSYAKLPLIRGSLNLFRMMVIGMRALIWSANESTDEKEEKISNAEIAFTLVTSFALALGIFMFLPYFMTEGVGITEEERPIAFNLITGIISIVFFILYVYAISFMSDVKRLFQYHGAEHMAIHCYEKGKALTVANVRKFSPIHPRCGTAFILIVFIVSIFVFSLMPSFVFWLFPSVEIMSFWPRKSVLFAARIAFIPLVAGVAYEILKASDKYHHNPILKLFSLPGLWMQRITTQPPKDDQIQVAIKSVKAAAGTK